MTEHSPIRLRLHTRLDARVESERDGAPVLLVVADEQRLVLRAARAYESGLRLVITGEPSLYESYTFTLAVVGSVARSLPAENLTYFEVEAELAASQPDYLRFLTSIKRTYQELGQDLRLVVPLAAEVCLRGDWFDTQVENLSYNGLFLRLPAERRVTPHELLKFRLRFSDTDFLEGAGHVVFVVPPPVAASLGGASGVGVRLDFTLTPHAAWNEALSVLHERLCSALTPTS